MTIVLELAGSYLAWAMLISSKVIWHCLFLLNVSVIFVSAAKCRIQNSHFHKTITYLTRFDNVKAK